MPLTTEQAKHQMFDFIGEHVSGIDKIVRTGREDIFYIRKDGTDYILKALAAPMKGSEKQSANTLVENIKEACREGLPTGVILLGSNANYRGRFLQKGRLEDCPDNVKHMKATEQALYDLYGEMAYFRPGKTLRGGNIEIVKFVRVHQIPLEVQMLQGSKDAAQRRIFHKEEGKRDYNRKMIKQDDFKDFTVDAYERVGKPTVAKLRAYTPADVRRFLRLF